MECYDARIAQGVQRLMEVRKNFAYGPRVDYFQSQNCIAFVRMGDHTHDGCAVIVSNADPTEPGGGSMHSVRMNVGANANDTFFLSKMRSSERVVVSPDGWGVFTCPPGQVEVWVKISET